jgi:RNA polymerase sigma factor (sigma-70 family)
VPPLALFDVDDVSKLVGFVIARSGLELSYHDREDLGQELTIHAWQIAETFDPERGSFSNYLFRTASLRIVDWQRKRAGRTIWKFMHKTYVRPRVELVSLDNELDSHSLGGALTEDDGNAAAVWDAAGRGLLEERDRERVRDEHHLGLSEAG